MIDKSISFSDDMFFEMNLKKKEKSKFTGYIMSKDNIVGVVSADEIKSLDPKAPVLLRGNNDFKEWLKIRSVDTHRTNSRLLRKALRLNTSDEAEIVLRVYAATITDTYWVKDEKSKLTYSDVKFKLNSVASLALEGDPSLYDVGEVHTPELTNIGSYEKCWKLKNGIWQLVKLGKKEEIFSELFTYYLGKHFKFKMAEYYFDKNTPNYIYSVDFTDQGNDCFEPMYSFIGDDSEDYDLNLRWFKLMPQVVIVDYLNMLFLDALVRNPDRHTFNYGILRDSDTGSILSLAPNFDNNLALIAKGYNSNVNRPNDLMITDFNKLIDVYGYSIPKLDKTDLDVLVRKVNSYGNFGIDIDYVINFIWNGYKQFKEV